MKKSNAFTLIELLVVIAIIGILAATILVSLNNVRSKTRDKERKANLNMIKNALEMYYSSHHNLPGTDGECFISLPPTPWGTMGTALSDYINMPQDPLNEGLNVLIYKRDSSSSYHLYTNLENTADSDALHPTISTGCSNFTDNVNYQISG